MSSDDNTENEATESALKKDFGAGQGSQADALGVLFVPDEMDIYVNKVTLEAYIFHGKKIEYETLDYLEYNPADHSVQVYRKDGTKIPLGVKIQWLVRPYFTKAHEISIVQTKDGESVDGTVVPLVHKGQKK